MSAAHWRPRLAETLAIISNAAAPFHDEWWVIGSAAAALAGADIADIGDVDLLLSEGDARRLLAAWPAAPAPPPPSDRFRSAVFSRFDHAPLAIEAFGGFEMKVRGRWRAVLPLTRETRSGVFIPSAAEQIALLETMARDKDRRRFDALRACL